MKKFLKEYGFIMGVGLLIGAASVALTAWGNPANMGLCVACFLRDATGSLHLHGVETLQYMRPEILGLVLGAFLISLFRKEWRPVGGSSPMARFVVGMIVMLGALVFLGCPLRLALRLGNGDLNAVVGLLGILAGIGIGIIPLKFGFTFGRAHKQSKLEGLVFPAAILVALVLLLSKQFLAFSESGPASQGAPILLAFGIALVIGVLSQSSRFCFVGGMRDTVMLRDFKLLSGYLAVIVAAFVGNVIVKGTLPTFSFTNQPIAHSEWLWNFLGMALVGWGSVLLGGCPLRQLILAGSGNSDSAITVLGFVAGAAICHNFNLASSAKGIVGGPVALAVIVGFAVLILMSIFGTVRKEA